MARHHGSTQFKRSWIKYDLTDLKVIKNIWVELTGNEFKPEPRLPLVGIVEEEIGRNTVNRAHEIVKDKEPYKKGEVYYVNRSNQATKLNDKLRPLIVLALAKSNYANVEKDGCLYIPHLPKQKIV